MTTTKDEFPCTSHDTMRCDGSCSLENWEYYHAGEPYPAPVCEWFAGGGAAMIEHLYLCDHCGSRDTWTVEERDEVITTCSSCGHSTNTVPRRLAPRESFDRSTFRWLTEAPR